MIMQQCETTVQMQQQKWRNKKKSEFNKAKMSHRKSHQGLFPVAQPSDYGTCDFVRLPLDRVTLRRNIKLA